MLLLSLGLHLAVAIVFLAGVVPRVERELRPVYTIDLTTLPVRDPQAGRPDGGADRKVEAQPPPPAALEPEPDSPAPSAPKPQPPPEPAPKAAPQPVAAPVPKKALREAAKPAPEESAKSEEDYNDTQKKIEELRRKRERQLEAENLAKTMAAIKAKDTRTAGGTDGPLGLPTGRGTEAGVDERTWIKAFIEKNWSLSKYQVVNRRDIEARVWIAYDASGTLIDYKIVKSSNDATFDDSIRRAVLKEKQLPFAPGRRLELNAIFNLKDLLD